MKKVPNMRLKTTYSFKSNITGNPYQIGGVKNHCIM